MQDCSECLNAYIVVTQVLRNDVGKEEKASLGIGNEVQSMQSGNSRG